MLGITAANVRSPPVMSASDTLGGVAVPLNVRQETLLAVKLLPNTSATPTLVNGDGALCGLAVASEVLLT